MSLLLDALKKAAEQKAKKGKSEAAEKPASDETLLDVGAVDETARLAADEKPRPEQDDETEFEQTRLEERLTRGDRIAGDDTSIDIDDSTQTHVETDPTQAAALDDTSLDVADNTEIVMQDEQSDPASADPTTIDVPEVTETVLMQEQDADDETGVDIPDTTETVLADEQVQGARADDATGIDITEADASAQIVDPGEQMRRDEDETIVFGSDDVSDFAADSELDSRRPVSREDQTDLNHLAGADVGGLESGSSAASAQSNRGDSDVAPDDETSQQAPADSADEDLSLMLQEPDPTTTGVTTGFTDPKLPSERGRVPAQGEPELSLADTTRNNTAAEQTDTQGRTITNTAATVLHGDDTLSAPTRTTSSASADSTSTGTYAPDNYDRTLMKLPSDDASKLFAGMKAEGDAVMTPDYAKKVFRSKTATQRTRHYQTYAGIALILFLLVGGYGALEYDDESVQIENSLRPLKRDPMPGIIKAQQEPEINLFGETADQVDARTIEIIESAADGVVASETAPEAEVDATRDVQQDVAADDAKVAMTAQTGAQSKPVQSSVSRDTGGAESSDARASTAADKGNLNIKTSSQYRQADIWLREAYEAYQSGNDELAMKRYSQVLEVDPGNRNALMARAAINVQNGNVDAAIRDYQTLLLMNPKDSLAMSSLLSIASYSPRETESQLKLMIEEEPDSPYLNFALANAYGAQNRWQEAQGHYFKALQNNPQDPNYAYNLAVSLEHIAQPRSAITYYQRALDNIGNGLATFSREVVDQRLAVLGNP